ncbi:MAG TPA: amino acid permease [Anaerolineaceae bacterium]|nr:amino acid permease [Anaerolineaceae bacterium]HPT22970.1 amino acid permease [Anaerolineaceae bacterium]
MARRKLRRQLNLLQVIMLGTAGTIAAEIFVLTGHAAGIAGPEAVLALVLGGVLTLSIALNYCELATTYPVTGGAMTYVGEGFGKGLLMFLVGSLDALSSTFYAALSAVGFAISLSVFVRGLPIVPTAIAVIVVVSLIQMRGITNVGNLQVVLGGFLLLVFGYFIIRGMTDPNGFSMQTYLSGRVVFENQSVWAHLGRMLTAIALTYNAYVGFEVIADDAEEITKPNRNIPLGILMSLLFTAIIYSMVSLVTIGTVPFSQLANSTTALTDAASRFWPTYGVPIMGAAGIVATLTSVNSAMLSATREAFTLSRDRIWPRPFSRLSQWRTPYMAIIFIGLVSALVAAIGLVDFLSFISSAGYMFVLFWATLAMPRLRRMHPDLERPFKVPLYPLTVYLAAGSGLIIIAFANPRALLFLGVVLVVLSVVYFISQRYRAHVELRNRLELEEGGGRVLVATKRANTAVGLVKLASQLVQNEEDTGICLFSVLKSPVNLSAEQVPALVAEQKETQKKMLEEVLPIASKRNVPVYTKHKLALRVEEGIFSELNRHKDVRLVLLGYPKDRSKAVMPHNILKEVMMTAERDVAVLRDRNLPEEIQRVLVPVGRGPNARLALQIAMELTRAGNGHVTALRLLTEEVDEERLEDETLQLTETAEEELLEMPENLEIKVLVVESVADGILREAQEGQYDLLIMGAGEEVLSPDRMLGKLNDYLIEEVPCSMLVVRRYQGVGRLWLSKQIKRIEENQEKERLTSAA